MSQYNVDNVSPFVDHEPWEPNSDYAPTPGLYGSPGVSLSALSPSPPRIEFVGNSDPRALKFLPLSKWQDGKDYNENPPTYIHYRIEWRVTVNNREVSTDTEEDVVLAPSGFWQLSLEKKLERTLRRKAARHRWLRPDDTVIVASTSDRTKRKLTKRFEDTDINWTAIEKQLLMWTAVFSRGKDLTLKISFNFVNDRSSPAVGQKGDKRGKTSTTQRMLREKDAQLYAEEGASGEKPIWNSVYRLMRCDSSTCQHGPHCWVDPMGKKHYPIKAHHIKRLISHVEEGGILESHKDVPEAVRDELYREEQQRLEKDKRKGGQVIGTGAPYPPINILNVLPSQSSPYGLNISTPQPVVDLTPMSPLEIPGPRDAAVREYGEWQVSNVDNDTLKTSFRQMCDVMLENGLDLEQVYKDQDPKFFIEKGVKIGIARRFVDDIGKWVKNVKNAMSVYETL